MIRRFLLAAALLATSAACGAESGGEAPAPVPTPSPSPSPSPSATTGGLPFTVTPVADFDAPWAMTFLPDRRMLVTEKKGALLLVAADGKASRTIATLPVDSAGQGGLMDVVLAPDFASSRHVYLSWSQAGAGGKGVVLARGTLSGAAGAETLTGIETLYRATPLVEGDGHYSGRIAFSPDGRYLFFTNGDRQKFTPAQDKSGSLGKVLRLTPDGKPAAGNPLTAQGFLSEVGS